MHSAVLRSLATVPILCTLASAGHISLGIQRTRGLDKRALSPRDAGSIGVELVESADESLYAISLSVGTPPQPFDLQLDTGSSDLWVPWAGAQACIDQGGCPGGDFQYNESSTFQVLFNNFSIQYGDGTGDTGDYFTDTVQLGNTTVQNFTMGLALDTTNGAHLNNTGQGLLGVSYPTNEAGYHEAGFETLTIYEQMVSQGLIARSAYSLYLDDMEVGKGTILFGGVDPSKYKGDLTVLPLQPDPATTFVDAFYVSLTDVSYDEGSDKTSLFAPGYTGCAVLLDSGTTRSYIPAEAFNNLVQGLGGYVDGTGDYYVPCDMPAGNATISFQFGGSEGIEMAIPLSTFISPDASSQLADGTNLCILALQAASTPYDIILGDSFLRSFYVVYDVANDQVAIATAALNATATGSVTAIPSGTSIPGASSTANLAVPTIANISTWTPTTTAIATASLAATFTDLPSVTAAATGATTGGASTSASASGTSSGTSSGAADVTAHGSGLVVVFFMAVSALFLF
ncbi:aspartic peptidase domain-containing protein [Exophiala viscosa]|uniref:Aspartic peptidase domain-containing protein n=1 Tax=Exophiala viscosa TaxID=2486360 RepID=A0AAN6E1T9_9EURO|nr:aspartic peptidase domain-containing protein [Exophiala viscosa]KAI1624024.1 aspartic peptidase domain-containing protein [Exophiala viscosa]